MSAITKTISELQKKIKVMETEPSKELADYLKAKEKVAELQSNPKLESYFQACSDLEKLQSLK